MDLFIYIHGLFIEKVREKNGIFNINNAMQKGGGYMCVPNMGGRERRAGLDLLEKHGI